MTFDERLQKIREEYSNGRGIGDGNTDRRETSGDIEGELQPAYGELASINGRNESGIEGVQRDAEVNGRVHSTNGRNSAATHNRNGGASEAIRGSEDSPSGLRAAPSIPELLERNPVQTKEEAKKERRRIADRLKYQQKRGKIAQREESERVAPISEPTPIRLVDAPVSRSWRHIFGGGSKMTRPLTEGEARDLREPLMDAIIGTGEVLDSLIYATVRDHTRPEIWSSLDDTQVAKIADSRLKAARKSAVGAQVVRQTIETYESIAVYVIIGPKMVETVQFYRAHGGIGIH